MGKKVVFNGIEILTNESDFSARRLLDIVEAVIDRLESDLNHVDENFNLSINVDFTPSRQIKHRFSVTNLLNGETRKKVMKILDDSTNLPDNEIIGTMKVDLQVQDV